MAYDIAILGDETTGLSRLDFNNRVVDGGSKLVQQVLILLFTDETEPLAFGLGTQLPVFLAGSNNYDEAVINNQFTIAASKVADALRNTQPLDLSDNEKLQRIDTKVTRSLTNPNQATAEITVVSQDEEATTVNLPIELTQVPGYG
jgi:hypothetical protein